MNPLLSRVLGNTAGPEPVREDVPVPCAVVPRSRFRDRLRRRKEDVRRVVGEAQGPDDGLIPDDAEEFEGGGQSFERSSKPVKDVVMEPRDPYADKEKLMAPSAALVAPDVTPQATQPLDPSAVPGGGPGERFRTSDAERDAGTSAAPNQPLPKRAMDVLLGRPAGPSQEASPDAVVTAESAYRMLGVQSPNEQFQSEDGGSAGLTGQAVLKEGQAMPDHRYSDGKTVLNVFRRFVG